jgi:hypothetical protein
VSSLNLHLTYRANPNVLINDNFRKFDKKTGYYSHTIGKDKIIFQLSRVLTYTYVYFFKLYFFFVSTTLHDFEYETTIVGWRRKELQIFY